MIRAGIRRGRAAAEGDDDPTVLRHSAFGREVRDALVHLYDVSYLQTHALAPLVVRGPGSPPNAGRTLQQHLLEAIEGMRPVVERRTDPHAWRGYDLLHLRYVESLEVASVVERLAISRSEYFRDHRRSLSAVISLLRQRWGLAAETLLTTADVADAGAPGRLPSAVPSPLTSFVGREEALADVRRLLEVSRLLTLTGAPGSGKTRLALHLAAELAGSEAVSWVELAPVHDPEHLPEAVRTAVGLRDLPGRPPLARLIENLRSRRVLLVLDNCEHLIDATARLAATLLRACSRLRILATSREVLGVPGEVAWRVPPLTPPDPRALPPSPRLMDYDAVRLFVERARQVVPGFSVGEDNAAAIAQICHRLDGIPLALELAAARLRALTVGQIAERLDRSLGQPLRCGGDTRRRQETLRASIDWSYALLSEPERTLFRRLSVFVGGWSLEAAEAIVGDDERSRQYEPAADRPNETGSTLPAWSILDLLAGLVDKSLVIAEPRPDGTRYRFLEVLRWYAAEQLTAAGEAERVSRRHRDWYLTWIEAAAPRLVGPEQRVWFEQIETEDANLRAAMTWSRDQPDGGEALLRFAAALGRFWHARDRGRAGRAWLAEALARAESAPSPARASALSWACRLEAGHGNLQTARTIAAEAVAVARAVGDDRLLDLALRNQASIEEQLGDLTTARALVDDALAVARRAGDTRETAFALVHRGALLALTGDPGAARPCLAEGLALGRQVGDHAVVARALTRLGQIALAEGNLTVADLLLREGLALARSLGVANLVVFALVGVGDLARRRSNLTEAGEWYREAVRRARETNDRGPISLALIASAGLAVEQGQFDRATRIFAAEDTWRSGLSSPVHPTLQATYASDREAARRGLGPDTFAATWLAGTALTLEQALALALGV